MTSKQNISSGSTIQIDNGRITDTNNQAIDLTDSRMDALVSAIENSKSEYGDSLTQWQSGVYRFENDRLVFTGSGSSSSSS